MPVGSVCLPVSNLPSATSFYLSILQPFGYQFVEKRDDKVGFGPSADTADFFLAQQTDGPSPTIANITFNAPSAAAVDIFVAAAVRAGASVQKAPILVDCETGLYTATVADPDGNKITASCEDERMSTASYPSGGRAPTVVSRVSHVSGDKVVETESARDGPVRVTLRTEMTSSPPAEQNASGDTGATTIMGTLLGVAAGATIAYVMSKDRQQSSPPSSIVRQAYEIPSPSPRPAIEYPTTQRSIESGWQGGLQQVPKLLKAASNFSSFIQSQRSAQTPPSPPAESHLSRLRGEPSVSGASEVSYSESKRGPFMIEAPPSHIESSLQRSVYPPSPPSSIGSYRSQRSERHRARSPSPARSSRSSRSKVSSRRSHSVASSQRTVHPEDYALPASVASRASRRSSVAHSSASRPAQLYPLPSSRATSVASWQSAEQSLARSAKASVVSHRPESIALPDSRKTSVVSAKPESHGSSKSRAASEASGAAYHATPLASRKTSVVSSHGPSQYALPESRKSSVVSSRGPEAYALPESRKTSVVSSRGPEQRPLPESRKTSVVSSRGPEQQPLPESRKTSVVSSRGPSQYPLPASVAGSSSGMTTTSTLKPPRSALGLGGGGDDDDVESLAPSDSISQMGSGARKHRKKVHRHHKADGEGDKASGASSRRHHGSSSGKDSKTRSAVSLPNRELKKEKDSRGVATLLGL